MTHLSNDQLRRWRDAPDDADRASVVGHLAVCNACAGRYAQLVRRRPAEDDPVSLPVSDFVARGLERATPYLHDVDARRPRTGYVPWAVAAAALLAIGVASWQVLEVRRLRSQIAVLEADRDAQQRAAAEQVGGERTRREALDRELQEERRARAAIEQELVRQRDTSPPNRGAPLPVLSLFLTPGRTRAEGQTKTLTVRENVDVRFVLAREGQPSFRTYDVEIRNSDGKVVWSRHGVGAGEQIVMVTAPGHLFAEDDYELTLRGIGGTGESERVGSYYFTILK